MGVKKRQARVREQVNPPRNEVVSLRYTSADLDLIEKAADRRGILITEFIRQVTIEQAKRDSMTL